MRPSTRRRARRILLAVATVFGVSTAATYYAAGHIRVLTGHSFLDLWRANPAATPHADGTPSIGNDFPSKETLQ